MFLLQCPQCGKHMKYQPMKMPLGDKKKQCVYCGFSYLVRKHILREIQS